MRSKIKIITAALLTLLMSIAVITPVIAASVSVTEPVAPATESRPSDSGLNTKEVNMETALLAVKNLISVDTDELTEFVYSYYDYQYDSHREPIGSWSFSWYNKDYSKSLYATALDNGSVISFDTYKSGYDYSKKLMDITRDQAEKIAKAFIKKIMPDSAQYYKCESYSTRLDSNTISLVYYAEVNGYKFYNLGVSINVNKFTGEITSMNRGIMQIEDYNFVSPDGVISEADALAAYNKKLGLELVYSYYYDYNKRELKVYPIYQVKDSGKYIDALTGEVISVSEGQYMPYAVNSAAGMAKEEAAMDMGGFSPAEMDALESVKNAITSDQAIKIIKDLIMSDREVDLGDVEVSPSLSKHYINKDQYIWNVYIYADNNEFSANASVDAKTGEVLSYSYRNQEQYKDTERLSDQELKKRAVQIIEKLLSANLNEYIDKTNYESLKDSNYYTLTFYKKVNGVPYLGSRVSVSLYAATGTLLSYSNNNYLCESFPDISAVKSTKQILDIVVNTVPYGIKYETTGYNEKTKKYDTALVYDFKSPLSQIDPFTGKFLSYDGTINETEIGEPDYSDITDDNLRKAVDALTDNGVELWNGKFLSSKELTEKEFYTIASSFFSSVTAKYYVYNEKEKPMSDSPIKRKDACKMICELLGYGDLAKNHKIFESPFSNAIDLEYKGYVAVCNGLNMLRSDNLNNMYNANANLTRADLVYMLYDYIKNN